MFVRAPWITRMQPPGIDGMAATWTSDESFALMPDARRFEEFETSFAARLGLGSAIDQALELGIDNIAERVDYLATMLRSELDALGTVTLYDGDGDRSGIVTFTVDGHQPESLKAKAASAGINVSVSDGPWIEPSSSNRFLTAVLRASPHYYNTEDELARLVDVIARLR